MAEREIIENSKVPSSGAGSSGDESTGNQLVDKAVGDIKDAAQSNSPVTEQKLQAAEQALKALQKSLGREDFNSVMNKVNEGVNSVTNLGAQYLPFLQVVGVDESGQIRVRDWADDEVERLGIDSGVIGPRAPVDKNVSRQLYAADGSVLPTAVEQGRLADCYFLAALQTLAQHAPDRIRNMIKESFDENGRHLYTVTFPGESSNPITVSEPSVYETTAFNQDRDGLWASVLEKAHRKLTGYQLNDPGGDSADAMKLLLGHDATSIPMNYLSTGDDTSNLADFMQKIIAQNQLFTVETRYDVGKVIDAAGNTVELDPKHQYALVSFDPVSNMVTLRNPHGSNDVDGTFKVEPDNIYIPSKFDEMLNRQNTKREKKNEIGGLLRINLNDFAKNFESVAIADLS